MKFFLTTLLIGSAAAFAPSQPAFATRTTALNAKESSRSEFLSQAAGLVAAAVIAAPGTANAAKYGSFGAGSPEVLNPTEAIIDEDILKSDAVQNALTSIKGYLSGVRQMEAALKSNSQTDVGPYLRKEFDFVKLRAALNTVNTAYDEDTQRGTDRLIRNIMQDITELETANRQKDGIERSSRRLEIMEGKLAKLGKAFEDYIAFAQ
mmetsp:Transcript_39616/g.55827  ORF Transcript_39616/g.55827 Transcript_39616/m.55827 type:complete len:207 (-) Transcript_39616:764-1384(-)